MKRSIFRRTKSYPKEVLTHRSPIVPMKARIGAYATSLDYTENDIRVTITWRPTKRWAEAAVRKEIYKKYRRK